MISGTTQRLLQVIYDLLRERGSWPTYRTVDLRLDRLFDIPDSQAALGAIPKSYLHHMATSYGFTDRDEVRLTLRGVELCDGGSDNLSLLVQFLRWVVGIERDRPLNDEEDLTVTSLDFAEYIEMSISSKPDAVDDPAPRLETNRRELQLLGTLINQIPQLWTGAGWQDESWRWIFHISPRSIRPYRQIETVPQLLDKVEPAEPASLQKEANYDRLLQATTGQVVFTEHPSRKLITDSDTGVEPELDSDPIDEPFDPEQIEVVTRNPTVSLLLSRLQRGFLDLQPDFQRHAGIWTEQNQSRLIESMLLRIPLPTFYAAEASDDKWIIVDGIQRLSTIARFIDPLLIYAQPLVLTGLDYLEEYEGKEFKDLSGRLQTRLLESEVVLHLIRRGTPESVMFNIFVRINTGGRPLTRQELRHALIPGPARDLLRELAESPAFLEATGHSVAPYRMDDREMVLRFAAFWMTGPQHYRPDFDHFLRNAMSRINEFDYEQAEAFVKDFGKAMSASVAIFEEHAFRKRLPDQTRRSPINKALFEAISVNLARRGDAELSRLESRRDEVQYLLAERLQLDAEFQNSISLATGDPRKVYIRFAAIDEILRRVE